MPVFEPGQRVVGSIASGIHAGTAQRCESRSRHSAAAACCGTTPLPRTRRARVRGSPSCGSVTHSSGSPMSHSTNGGARTGLPCRPGCDGSGTGRPRRSSQRATAVAYSPHRRSLSCPSSVGSPATVVVRSTPPSPCRLAPCPSEARGVGRTRTAADGRVRSPWEPRCPGQPFTPSVARGVGRSRAASVRVRPACPMSGTLRPAVALADARLSATVGVGRSWPRARLSRLGRTAAPEDGDWLVPYGTAVGVGSRWWRVPPG